MYHIIFQNFFANGVFEATKTKIKNRYAWSENTFNTIEWDALHTVINESSYNRTQQYNKFIHYYLPVGKLNFTITSKCPYCGEKENSLFPHHQQDHFMCCSKMTEPRRQRINTLKQKLLNIKTRASLTRLIIEMLQKFYGDNISISCPPEYIQFYNEQQKIGFNQIARGRISKSLLNAPIFETKNQGKTSINETTTWIKKLIRIMLNSHLQTWIVYNEFKHRTTQSIDLHMIEDLQQKSKFFEFDLITRQWFDISYERMNSMSQIQLTTWLTQAKQILQRAKKNRNSFQQPITRFFQPTQSNAQSHSHSSVNKNKRNIHTLSNNKNKEPPFKGKKN